MMFVKCNLRQHVDVSCVLGVLTKKLNLCAQCVTATFAKHILRQGLCASNACRYIIPSVDRPINDSVLDDRHVNDSVDRPINDS